MNWGWKIALGYIGFVLFILYMVYRAVGVDFELVTPDYYSAELAFQGQIDKQQAAHNNGYDVEVFAEQDGVAIKFLKFQNSSKHSGSVSFMRYSDKKLDRTFDWQVNDKGMMYIPKTNFQRGQYIFKLEGMVDETAFFIEKQVFIP